MDMHLRMLKSAILIALPLQTRAFTSITSFRPFLATNTSIMSTSDAHQHQLQPLFKRAKLDALPASTKTIGTHSGSFQADEALGVWLLRQLPLYRRSPVVRSRDPSTLDKCDIVIDVGGVYDHSKLLYDHHQRGYDERFTSKIRADGSVEERCTKLSASGLVYRHYGKDVIREHYPSLNGDLVELAYEKMYNSFMESIDAIDTGVEPIPSPQEGHEAVKLQYVDRTGLSARVGRCNPRWNEIDETTGKTPDADARFEVASSMCGDDFLSMLTHIVESDLPARSYVETAVTNRHEVDPSGEIIVFPSGGLPWKNHLYELEHQYKINPLIKYVLYTDQAGMWRIQCVSVEGQAFENRLSLPKEWRGVRDEDLAKVAGIEGCTFCHAAGFIGGNKSYEGALEMARVALKVGEEEE